MTFGELRTEVLAWEAVEEGTSYGSPAFKVRGKLLTRVWEDGDTLVVLNVPAEERGGLLAVQPEVFHLTEHYRQWPIVLVRLSTATPEMVLPLLSRTWESLRTERVRRR